MADLPADLAAVWPRALDHLLSDTQRLEAKDHRWLQDCQPLALVSGTALLGVPNEYAKSVLEGRLAPLITDALTRECGQPVRLAVTVTAPPPDRQVPEPQQAPGRPCPRVPGPARARTRSPSPRRAPPVPAVMAVTAVMAVMRGARPRAPPIRITRARRRPAAPVRTTTRPCPRSTASRRPA